MPFNELEDLRPVPSFPRLFEEKLAEPLNQRLYKPTQYRLTKEKRLLTFDKEPATSR